jgi:hypothetical protein
MAKFSNHPEIKFKFVLALFLLFCAYTVSAQTARPRFRTIAFFTAKNDQAHISFVQEANRWLKGVAEQNQFSYDTTSNWKNLNPSFLADYQVVLFLDTRPEEPDQRHAFQQYMDQGGSWMGFHFSGFALDNSTYPQNWAWYHETFLGSGSYRSNTWRPTSAILRNESPKHPALKGIGKTFKSSPNEWYRWTNDLTKNKDIQILLSIDSSSFPVGTGPKQSEIWHSGYYPVAWSNKNYKMVYVNMGHNDIDYEHNSKKELSYTFDNADQNRFILNALLWLGRRTK